MSLERPNGTELHYPSAPARPHSLITHTYFLFNLTSVTILVLCLIEKHFVAVVSCDERIPLPLLVFKVLASYSQSMLMVLVFSFACLVFTFPQ